MIEAGLRVAQRGTSSVRYEIGVFAQGDERASAQGYLVHVYVDRISRRPVPIPVNLSSVLEKLA
jgi:acyl-CoA thioester hydrolase